MKFTQLKKNTLLCWKHEKVGLYNVTTQFLSVLIYVLKDAFQMLIICFCDVGTKLKLEVAQSASCKLLFTSAHILSLAS